MADSPERAILDAIQQAFGESAPPAEETPDRDGLFQRDRQTIDRVVSAVRRVLVEAVGLANGTRPLPMLDVGPVATDTARVVREYLSDWVPHPSIAAQWHAQVAAQAAELQRETNAARAVEAEARERQRLANEVLKDVIWAEVEHRLRARVNE